MLAGTPRISGGSGGGGLTPGTTPVIGGTPGSVLFVGAGPVIAQDNANFFYDQTNHRLNLGTTSPTTVATLAIRGAGASNATNALFIENSTPTEMFLIRNDGTMRLMSTASNANVFQVLAANNPRITVGRTSNDIEIAVASSANAYWVGSVAGDGFIGSIPAAGRIAIGNETAGTASIIVNTQNNDLQLLGSLIVPKTITAIGTTGAQTINKMSGSVNFAAGAFSVVVTNSLVTANSVIMVSLGTVDATMTIPPAVVAGAGSFTLTTPAAPTATTRVNFFITN